MFQRTYVSAILLVVLAMVSLSPAANAQWSNSSWTVDRVASYTDVTGDTPGAADYYETSPYAYAYKGQSSSHAWAYGRWYRTATWTYYGSPSGSLNEAQQVVGTIGFYTDDGTASYTGNADGLSRTGPADFNVTDGSTTAVTSSPFTYYVNASAFIANWGHASGQVSAIVGS